MQLLVSSLNIIISYLATAPDHAELQIEVAKNLVAVARKSSDRLIFILGAGSLHTGNDHHLFVEDIAKLPDSGAWINILKQQLAELEFLQTVSDVDWLGISPSMSFVAGKAAEHYVIGGNDLLLNQDGKSEVTAGTMAQVVVNEIINSKHHQERITVVDA